MGIFLAAAPPGEGHRGLASGAADARPRHRLRPWGAFPYVGRERRPGRRGDGRPRVARPVGGGEESDEGSGGRGPGPDYPCRRRIVAVPGQIVRRSRGDPGARAPGRTPADHGRNPSRTPIPDRVMQVTPRALSRSVATLGTRPLPLGLQLYAEFTKN